MNQDDRLKDGQDKNHLTAYGHPEIAQTPIYAPGPTSRLVWDDDVQPDVIVGGDDVR